MKKIQVLKMQKAKCLVKSKQELNKMKDNNKEIKKVVKEGYSKIASKKCSCQCGCNSSEKDIAKQIGYSKKDINDFSEANLGLGCGNPVALSKLKEGEIVLDFGSGAGFDSFLAVKKVGKTGKVIGIDMTEKMIEKAKINAKRYGYDNVEFRLGDIENIPIEDNFADVIISNCVINLSPDKDKVFLEAYRVLKKSGRMYLSDIVLLGELTTEQKTDNKLLVGCVAGALQKQDYIKKIEKAGFKVNILDEDKSISKKQYSGIALESIKLECIKK
jgi:arsenite methyltransferase